MLSYLKFMRLRTAVLDPRHLEDAFSAVLELGRAANGRAVEVLLEALDRKDAVARSAARELGRIGDPQSAEPLANALRHRAVREAAREALVLMGDDALNSLVGSLRDELPEVRLAAVQALGEMKAVSSVDALVEILSHDNDYAVRTAAAHALGLLKDQRAVWVLVGTLKLRGETTPERQAALQELQEAASLALRRLGDPLAATRSSGEGPAPTAEEVMEKLEDGLADSPVHPKLLGDLSLVSEEELIGVMKELVMATEEISWAKLESRDPMLASYFQTYDQRCEAAEKVGEEILKRSGEARLQAILADDLENHSTMANWWRTLLEELP